MAMTCKTYTSQARLATRGLWTRRQKNQAHLKLTPGTPLQSVWRMAIRPFPLREMWRGSSVGQSMRLISAVSGGQFPPSLPQDKIPRLRARFCFWGLPSWFKGLSFEKTFFERGRTGFDGDSRCRGCRSRRRWPRKKRQALKCQRLRLRSGCLITSHDPSD